GKTGHFRKSGIGVPQNIFKEDLQRLFALVQFFKPAQLLFVGDLFHSHANKEMDLFLKWRKDVPALVMCLIKGNHDILSKKFYKEADIKIVNQKLSIQNFCFTHDIEAACDEKDLTEINYTFSGHIHPGIRMSGGGRQELYLPCFYFAKKYAVLPAFSRFTGLAKLKPKKTDKVFVVADNAVLKIQ
ncbi:MAG: ligase-associated DNA damage response endonuclease PdeM, partial [Ginsengibacter sp.]